MSPGRSHPSADSRSSGPRPGNPVPEGAVAGMFDSIAPVYDRMNTLMTAGLDGRWRRAAVKATRLSRGDAALDVACGTGKLTALLAGAVGPMGRVVGVDLAPVMLEKGREACADLVQVQLIEANALALPFPDATFDAATIAFGLRNLADFEAGFREMGRVVRPGGRVVCLELTMPRPRALGGIYAFGFGRVAPALGRLFGRREAYAYLPDSLKGFPEADELAGTMRRAGLVDVAYRRLAPGVVALHTGEVPGRS